MARQALKIEQKKYEELVAEYERHKSETISRLERAGDWISGVDERLDFLAPKILEALSGINEIKADLVALQIGDGVKKIQQIPFIRNLPVAGAVGSGARLTELAPHNGYIKKISVDWPLGCNHLVDIFAGHGLTQILPREGTVALNGELWEWNFNEYVEDHEEIWVDMNNGDGGNPHLITAILFFEEAS